MQLSYIPVMAFSQTDLILVWIYREFRQNLYLPSAMFIARGPVEPSKQLKQVIEIEHNIAKNPIWQEANQLFS